MKDEIIEGLKPLFKIARENNLMFHCNYQDIILSPDELEEHQRNGRFCWGAVNWNLVSPKDRYEKLLNTAKVALKFAEDFKLKYIR